MTAVTPTPNSSKTIFGPIARFSKKAIKFVFKTIAAIALAAIILAILLPISFFAVRASQPMEASQFNGLTFYQYMTWRVEMHKATAAVYQATHSNVYANPSTCYLSDSTFVIFAPMSEFYTLAGKFPTLRRFISPRDYKYVPTDVTWATMPSAWWTTYETAISTSIHKDTQADQTYCQLPQYPPTPEQLTAQKP